MVLAITADDTESTTAGDGSTIPGVLMTATGLTSAARLLRWWRQNLDGSWQQVPTAIASQTATTETAVDWTCPTAPLDPDNPATPYTYGVSFYLTGPRTFTFASAVMASPGRAATRPGPGAWLLHPWLPERSLPFTIESDLSRRRAALASVQQPYGRQAPIVTVSGYRALRTGTLTLNLPRSLRPQLSVLVDDGDPLFLAQPCGAADTDDGWLYLSSVSDDVIASETLRVVCDYQRVWPLRTSPPSVLSGNAQDWYA